MHVTPIPSGSRAFFFLSLIRKASIADARTRNPPIISRSSATKRTVEISEEIPPALTFTSVKIAAKTAKSAETAVEAETAATAESAAKADFATRSGQVDNLAGNYADIVFSYSTQGTLLVRTTKDSRWTKLTGSVV